MGEEDAVATGGLMAYMGCFNDADFWCEVVVRGTLRYDFGGPLLARLALFCLTDRVAT